MVAGQLVADGRPGLVALGHPLHRVGGGVGGLDLPSRQVVACSQMRHCALACGCETTLVICSRVTPGRARNWCRMGMPDLADYLQVVDLVGEDVDRGRDRALDGVLDGDDGAVDLPGRHGFDGVLHGCEGQEAPGAPVLARSSTVSPQRHLGEGALGPQEADGGGGDRERLAQRRDRPRIQARSLGVTGLIAGRSPLVLRRLGRSPARRSCACARTARPGCPRRATGVSSPQPVADGITGVHQRGQSVAFAPAVLAGHLALGQGPAAGKSGGEKVGRCRRRSRAWSAGLVSDFP